MAPYHGFCPLHWFVLLLIAFFSFCWHIIKKCMSWWILTAASTQCDYHASQVMEHSHCPRDCPQVSFSEMLPAGATTILTSSRQFNFAFSWTSQKIEPCKMYSLMSDLCLTSCLWDPSMWLCMGSLLILIAEWYFIRRNTSVCLFVFHSPVDGHWEISSVHLLWPKRPSLFGDTCSHFPTIHI